MSVRCPHRSGVGQGWSAAGQLDASNSSAARSPMTMAAALVCPRMICGITDASATRSPSIPRTRRSGSTTEPSSAPIRAVPVGW